MCFPALATSSARRATTWIGGRADHGQIRVAQITLIFDPKLDDIGPEVFVWVEAEARLARCSRVRPVRRAPVQRIVRRLESRISKSG